MKITRKNLEKIIKEEIEEVIKTVSADQLDLENILEIFRTGGSAYSDAELSQWRRDIKAGKKDKDLDHYVNLWNCNAGQYGNHGIEGEMCPAVNHRRGVKAGLATIVIDMIQRSALDRETFLRDLRRVPSKTLLAVDKRYVAAKKANNTKLMSKLRVQILHAMSAARK